jgi:hypothetical protein
MYTVVTMKEFTPGLQLSRLFFERSVKPIIERLAPDLQYAAALLGSGSEVSGSMMRCRPITIGDRG